MNFKKVTPRDPAYLAWIRTQKCVFCGRQDNIQAHHTESGGMAIKGSDYSSIPVCAIHHADIHHNGGKSAINHLRDIIIRLRADYESRNDKQKESK